MKCLRCGNESKEEKANFCFNCGQSLHTSLPASVNQEIKYTTLTSGSGDHIPAFLTDLESGKELIADVAKSSSTSEQSKISEDEPQPLRDTSPPVKKRKKRNRKKSKKKTDSDTFISLPTNLEDSCIVESENDDESKSFTDCVTDENTQPTTIGNADATNTPATTGNGKTEPNNGENLCTIQENAVSKSIKHKPVHKETHKMEDQEERSKVSYTEDLSYSSKKEDAESMVTNSANLEVKRVHEKKGIKHDKTIVEQVKDLKTPDNAMDISSDSVLGNEHHSQNIKNKDMSNNIPGSGNENDTSIIDTQTKDQNSSKPDMDSKNQISNKSASSERGLEVESKIENTKNRVSPTCTGNKEGTKVDASTKVSINEEKNNCGQENIDHTGDGKICEIEPTIKPENKNDTEKETEESAKDSPPDSFTTLIQKDAIKYEDEKGSKNKNKKKAQQKGETKENAKKDKTAEHLQGGVGIKDSKVDASTKVSTNEEINNCAQANKDNENIVDETVSEAKPTAKPQNKPENEKPAKVNKPDESSPSDSFDTSKQKDTKKKEEGKGSKNKNNKAQQKEDSNNNKEDAEKGKTAANLQGGAGKSSNKEKTDNKEEQKAPKRELDPDNCITVYFHVIVSKYFNIKVNGDKVDKVIVRGGKIKGYQEWTDAICTLNFSKEIKDRGFLFEGHTQISKESLDKDIPYKYIIVRPYGKEDYEFIYNIDGYDNTPMNRCLHIQSRYIHAKEWHQYDDVCMKENRGLLSKIRSVFQNRYSVIFEGKMVAGEVMLSRIFSILTSCDHINLSNFFIQLRQFHAVYKDPLLIGDRRISWKSLEFGVDQVHYLILKHLNRVCEPFLGRRTLQEDDIKDKLMAGLVCVMVVNSFDITVQEKDLADICTILCLDEMPREKMILELQRAKNTFCKVPGMDNHVRTLCQKCIDANIDEWVWVLPVFHAFSAASNPDLSYRAAGDQQEDVWAGLERLAYDRVKKRGSDLLKKMILKKYLLQADLALIQSWLCLIPINHMAEFLDAIPLKIVSALKACYFKFPGAEFDHREKIGPILKKLIQLMEKQGKPPNADALQLCCKASLDLHNCICCCLFLKNRQELPALSAEIILTLLRISGLSHQYTEKESESDSQELDLENVLNDALLRTRKWLEDVYGHKFNFHESWKFSSELSAWNLILKAGDNVTPKWKDSLLCVLMRKLKQEDPINQISLYCKEQYRFKDLHPSINKCFEDCAIEAVHMACQSETNILGQLSSYNLGNFGRLVSSVIENSWPKDNQGNHIKDSDGILQHLLTWADATYIFKLYGTDTSIISQFGEDIQELVVLSESVFLEAVRNIMDGDVLFKHMESILKHKEQFVAICKLKIEKKEKLSLGQINQVLIWRKEELYRLRSEREWVDSLLKMINSVDQYIKVNISEIHSKHLQDLGQQKLMDILLVKTHNSSDGIIIDDSYYNLSTPAMTMAEQLNTFRNSHVFTSCWERQARALAESSHEESSNESEDDDDDLEFTVEQIVDKLYNPCLNNCKKIYNDLKSGQVTFEVVDVFLAAFKDNYQALEKELKTLCDLEVTDNKRWIPDRVRQIEQYHQLDVAFRSAKVIFDVKSFLKLKGDFQTLETLLQFADSFENYKQKPLSCISQEVMKTKKLLSEINENHSDCLMEVLKRKEFFLWVQDALEDVNELKVFVDLASISAGENDMDVDRVACFHDAVLGYSPLLYDLKPEFGFKNFMECLEKLWKALKSDPKLPEKLRDSARHIEWLKTVKESHGSVELSSLSLATTINQRGIYVIRAPKDSKKITPDSVLRLVLLENEDNKRYYTLEELKELLNKLMLMSGKGEQGNSEVDKFSEIFSNVQRLAGSFIDLYLAGNMLFRTWEAEIYCKENTGYSVFMNFNIEEIDELQGQEALTDLLPKICKTMESVLEEWLAFVNQKRSELYYLNYYTAEQVVYLCQQYQMRDISEEALVMLSFIKPDCKKIDTISSSFILNTGSCYVSTVRQPDLMDFAMDLKDCTDVSKKLELVWKFSMDNMSSFFPGCLDLNNLGTCLAALAEQNKRPVVRDLHPSLQPGRPNLILCPPSEILSCAIAVYMHSPDEPLPSYDEVLLCTHHTTYEEVALFLRRCLTTGYKGKKIYSLIYADQLSYDVGYKSEMLFQQLQSQCKFMDNYKLVIVCNAEREHCYIPSVFSQFKIHVIPQMQPLEIHRYLCTHFKVGSDVVSAGSVFKNGMSSGIVSSKRAGVGKSLYVKRLYQKLVSKFSSKKPRLKIIRLINPEVNEDKVLETLLPFLDGKSKNCPIIFHIDITSSVNSGISEFLFKLLILQYLMDSQGRIWKRLPSHLYIIEILESSDILFKKQFKSVPRIVQNGFIDFFPKIFCCSPKEVLTKTTQANVADCGDPGMDNEEFRSECFQRPYQYLIRFDQGQNLDAFVYIEGHTEGNQAQCLQIFLLYCGIVDPSWSELRNFAWFLNLQLRDCEASVFCNHEFVGDTLQGFKNFVVNFMILMAKDFATPSLHIADQSPGRYEINLDGVQEQDLVPFLMRKKWESEPHPYIFFNEDHASMTFIGFHLQPNNAGGVDAINPRNNRIIRQNVMSLQLYEGLRLQRVPFNTDFDQLPRHEKINSLCMVLGIQWPMDPDDTYELTMDNMLKILAIKMRFRCGIPVVVMGETGCGKTRLIKFLCHLCKGFVETENMKLVKVHGGTTAETIYQKILEAQEIAQINKEEGCETVLFFDEANTTEAISSIKEALCDHTVEGVPLEEDSGLHIIAACNPYRKHTDDMIKRLESAGLGYKVRADETKERLGSIPLRQLVYRVHALPPSMMPLVWDFGQLNNETEKKYIQQIVLRLAKEIQLSTNEIQLLIDVLSASQSYMREKNDECSFVSLRDVERCIEVFKWFYNHHEKLLENVSLAPRRMSTYSEVDKASWSLVLAVGVCYHASLETKDSYRRAICKFFSHFYRDPTNILKEITSIQDLFLAGVQLRDTIARNLALKENLFMMVICIELKIPLFLVGKPGSSKSLAKTIVADAMQGQAAHTQLYKDLRQIHLVSFQCSPHSTPEGIIGTFRHCARFQEGKNLNEYVSVVVLDEIGLAEDSPKMPLKTLHPLLEDGCIDDDTSPHKKVGFIGISNWALDPAKMNRGIFVSRGDPSKKELIESARGICSSDKLTLPKVSQYFHTFSESYLKVCETLKEQEFFGLRDFYSLIKMVFAFTKQSKDKLTLDEIARAVLRNFSGKDEVNALEIFLRDDKRNVADINTIDLVMENIRSESDDCRYLLILTKNYAALQILQQAFLKENEQPEIIFGSSFPKDQEYTQICRNINRVKICMETGQMVILLNLQNLYESLYDALNQYYVSLAGQKYVDLGLGTHRVKCRVHKKFRLIVIEEKEIVYKDFPIPLINRLEKHYLDINTFLKKEHKVIVQELETWVTNFTKGNPDHTMGKAQTYKPSDVFIGYHSDTCASVVLQVTENMKQSHTDVENITGVKNKAVQVLLNCATPDSVIRLDWKALIDEYFKKQKHGSLLDFLCCCHVTTGYDNHTIFTEITTFSRLLTSADRKVLETELQSRINSIEILSLQQFDTEFSFLKKIRSFLESSSGNLILIIQTDFEEGSQGANLVASAKYSAVNEIQKVDLTEGSVFVYFITKLPRMQGGTSYVGFRGGLWQSIHIDDLRKSKDMVEDVTALQNLTISSLFSTEEKKEPVKDNTKHKANMETEMEVELTPGNEDDEIQARGDEEDMKAEMDIDTEDQMETENETAEDQEMEINVSLPKPENMLDTTILIRSCVQNAIGLLRDDENVESRSTKRIEILISLLSTEDQIKNSFLKMLKCRLYKLLKIQEQNIYIPEQWVTKEASNQDALQEAGTFRQSLWRRVQTAVTPLLSQILSVLDRNANLDLLMNQHVENYVKCLWMHIFHDEKLLPISDSNSSQTETILVKNYMNISVFGENGLPFSWRIRDYLEDIWTQAQHIDSVEGPEMKFLEIFCKTSLGNHISSQEENAQHNLFLNYKRDFILMTMSISSAEELKIMEFALSACIEELRSSTKAKDPLMIPWVHIGYSKFQHRLQNLNRILVVNPSVLDSLLQKIVDPKPMLRNEMVLDVYAAIACLESLKHSMQTSDPQEWKRQVKNIQVPIELTCSEGYLQGQGPWCKTGIRQIRVLWNSVFSMALFMEHLLVEENLLDENMQGLIRGHTFFLGRCLESFTDIKTVRPFMAVVDALHRCRNEVAESVSRFGMQLCTVCRGDPNEPICLECAHVFCRSCLKQWLDTGNRTCPLCKLPLPENFPMVVSKEMRESIQKNAEFRKQCNGFFVDIVCNLCFKDNSPPDDEVIHHLLSFVFNNTESVMNTRSLSPFEDAVDKTPVIRSVILKLLLKYSLHKIVNHAQEYLNRVKRSNLLKLEDTKEVYLLFINCLEDSLYEKKQKLQNENEQVEYFKEEGLFLQDYLRSSKRQRKEETSVQLLQDVARVRLALDVAAEMWSVKPRGGINERYMRCVMDICSQSGNDWYRVYLIRKLANLYGVDIVQQHFKDPDFRWLFPRQMLQNKDTETNHMDHFLVCGESYKVLREGISRAMMEGKEERIAAAIQECKSKDQELAVHLLLAVLREITLYYGVRNNAQQGTAPEQESVKDFITNAQMFKDISLRRFLETLLNNNRPFLRADPGMRGSHVTIFGLAVHLASILLSGNNHLFSPLKNLSFSSARMQNSYLPTMPEDMLSRARTVMTEQLHWYMCPNGHYCAIGECGQPMQTSRCLDCGANIGGQNHVPLQGFQRIQQDVDRTQTGHVLGDPNRQGPAVAPDRDIAAPAFILLRMITHLAMLLGSEEDMQSLMHIVKPPVRDVTSFLYRHIERDLEYLRNSLGKSTDDTTTVVHLVLNKMLSPKRSGQWPVNFDDVWSTKEMRNIWEKHFASMVIAPVLKNLDRDLMDVNNYIRQDERISSNPIVKVLYGDPLISGEKMDLPQDSNVHCSKIWSCRERISVEYILHAVQQKDGKDTLPLLWKFLEKETELQMVKFLPDILKLQKDLMKKFQNYKDITYKTIGEFIDSINSDGARYIFEKRIGEFILAWNHLRLSLQTNGEIKLPEGLCDKILTKDSEFEFLLPRRQGNGLGATALTSYLIALHNNFIYALAKYTNIEQKYSIKASEVMDLHVISYELEKDLVPIILSNCQYSLESGKETLQEFDFPKIQHQLTTLLFQGKPLITMVGLPTLTLSHDRNYENLFTDVKKKLPQDSLSNSAIDVISKDLNAFSDVCEALNIVDISLGFLATSGGDPELSLTEYVEDVLQMGEQSSTHVLEALKRFQLKNTIALWQLLTALKSQHLLHLKRDPFANVDHAYKQELGKESKHALNVFLEQNGTNCFLLELHEMIMLKLGKPQSIEDFRPSWILRDVLPPLLDDKEVSFPELETDFPEQIALAHCIEAWKVAATKKWNRI